MGRLGACQQRHYRKEPLRVVGGGDVAVADGGECGERPVDGPQVELGLIARVVPAAVTFYPCGWRASAERSQERRDAAREPQVL
eukprot:3771098-Prymnesium_polylepis.4